jgi:AcrR family transcriptional regulator
MVVEPRRRVSRERRRELIEAAAAALFAERGFAGARSEDIAGRAGITKQLLYRHFSDKEELYLALLERHREDLGRFAGVLPAEGSLEERLRAVLEVWLDYVEEHAYAWKMLFRDTGGGPGIQAFREEVHARAREVIVEFLRELAVDPLPPDELEPLAELISMGQGSLVLFWIDHPDLERRTVVDAISRVWLGVLTVR